MTKLTPTGPYRYEAPSVESAWPERRLHRRSIAVIGAAGFIGSSTLRALTAFHGSSTTAVVRQEPPVPHPRVRYVIADTNDLRSLTRALENIDVVVHAASYTGADERLSESINYTGIQNVLAASAVHDIEHVINISTIGVYGPGPFGGIVEDGREPDPVTPLSATKVAADCLVRSHGGITIRPGFVYGHGDRWFLPGLQSIHNAARAWIEDGSALLSVISIDELGTLIAELARTCTIGDQGSLYHAAHPTPKAVRDIAIRLSNDEFTIPNCSLTYAEALSQASDFGLTARQIDLAGRDHWFDASKLWGRTGLIPIVEVVAD